MEHCDVLVVGGGPAGSSLAWALRSSGLDVVVLDRSRFPRDKLCAGWITPEVVEALELDLPHYSARHTLQPIHAFRVGLLGQASLQTPSSREPLSYGIRRREFDDYLLRRCGARLMLGRPLSTLEPRDDGWTINGRIRAPLVVGAGGHFCPVARTMGATTGRGESAVLAREIEIELGAAQLRECAVDPTVPELYFRAQLDGYGWLLRKGRYLNLGLGIRGGRGLREKVDSFHTELAAAGRIPADLPRSYRGHAYLLYTDGSRRWVDDGLLLVGDAAGLAYPASGEGILPAVESGRIAAEVITRCGGDYRRGNLACYSDRLLTRFGRRGAAPRILNLLPHSALRVIASRLLDSAWFVDRFVMKRWFLHAQY